MPSIIPSFYQQLLCFLVCCCLVACSPSKTAPTSSPTSTTTEKRIAFEGSPISWQHAQGSLLDTIVPLTSSRSIYGNPVDWAPIIAVMNSIYYENRLDSIQSIGKAAAYMFEALGDHHGFLMYDYKIGFSI